VIVVEEQGDLLKVHVYGELTLADYREFEAAVGNGLKAAPSGAAPGASLPPPSPEPKMRLLMDLTRMSGFTLDVAWEEIRFTRAHAHDFRRIAVVSNYQWLGWAGWLSAAFTDAEVKTFDNAADAEAWLRVS